MHESPPRPARRSATTASLRLHRTASQSRLFHGLDFVNCPAQMEAIRTQAGWAGTPERASKIMIVGQPGLIGSVEQLANWRLGAAILRKLIICGSSAELGKLLRSLRCSAASRRGCE